MKHILIVNPAAGRKDATELVKQALQKTDTDYEIYDLERMKVR